MEPAVLVTATLKVPIGVPPVGVRTIGGLASVPQATRDNKSRVITPIDAQRFPRTSARRRFPAAHVTSAGKSNPRANSKPGLLRFVGALMATVGAVVLTVKVTVVGMLVALTELGTNVQVVLAGKGPQLKVTAVGKVPCAVTLIEYVAEPPRVTVTVAFATLKIIWGCTEVTPWTVNG